MSNLTRFIHDASFTPTSLFTLDYSPLSTATTITDSNGVSSNAVLSFITPGTTVGSLIESLPAITGLGSNTYYST